MTAQTELKLAQSRRGRTFLHIITLNKDHQLRFHIKGIMREVKHQ